LEHLLSLQMSVRELGSVVGFLAVAHFIFACFKLYESKRLSSLRSGCIDVVQATTLITVILAIFPFVLHIRSFNLVFLSVFWVGATICTTFSRLIVRSALAALRRCGQNSRQMLIVGTNTRAVEFAKNIEASPQLGYRIVGFSDFEWSGRKHFQETGRKVLCDLVSLPDYLRINVVDEVVLALPVASFHQYCSQIAAACEDQGILIRVVSDLFDLRVARTSADQFEGGAVITLSPVTDDGWPVIEKRTMDFVLSAVLILALSPVLIAAALAIKLTSPGPILFVQERLGLNKRRFQMCKFRTMCVDAEQRLREIEHLNEVSGPVFKMKNDPRVSSVGRFLRKTSIDELPQLFNVLKGDMSLVGPRPMDVRDYDLMTQNCATWQRCRFSMRPGITCLWQVNGRNSIPFEQWMELDRQYVYGWSLWLDLKILLRTIPVVLRGSGAA
jgi:exopolysaccharide biosynthesis polyprenyl glycosylphosphotransferase